MKEPTNRQIGRKGATEMTLYCVICERGQTGQKVYWLYGGGAVPKAICQKCADEFERAIEASLNRTEPEVK